MQRPSTRDRSTPTAVSKKSKPFAVWLTGLPASGKSRVTAALVHRLKQDDVYVAVLESDALRKLFSLQPSYDEKDREQFYGSLAFIGKVLVDNDVSVIFDATANRRAYRDRARALIPRFFEVYVDTPLEVCMKRDPKGIYKSGAPNVPGLGARYEAPRHPDLIVHGDSQDPETAAERIVEIIRR
jgi:adenylylsulfate kinase